MLVALVAVEKTSLSFDKLFEYLIPESLICKLKVGCLVWVSFGKSNRLRQAMVCGVKKIDANGKNYKSISEVLCEKPIISRELLGVAEFMQKTCFCTWFEAIKCIIPSGLFYDIIENWNFKYLDDSTYSEKELVILDKLKAMSSSKNVDKYIKTLIANGQGGVVKLLEQRGVLFKSKNTRRKILDKKISMVKAKISDLSVYKLTKKQKLLLEFIKKSGVISAKKACYSCGVTDAVLKNLINMNLVEICQQEIYRNPYKNAVETKLVDDIILNEAQKKIVAGLVDLLEKKAASVALLRGVTGSGKTIVFLKLIDHVFKLNKQCILMVPEISLTPQMVSFFQSFFGEKVAVIHSSLTKAEKLDEHKRILRGEAQLVIGTRSAVFAPCENLGLIIMDEEGEQSYKSSEMAPRYHARDVARYRCFRSCAVLLLASATPSIQTQYFAKIGKYKEFVLNNRYKKAQLPEVLLVDLKKSDMSPIPGMSLKLFNELEKNLQNNEQSILLLNRRGYSSSAVCLDCGQKIRCRNCSAPMTYHNSNDSLMCHYCGYIQSKLKICPYCDEKHILYQGQGTQKIELDISANFPGVRVLRLDADSVFTRLDLEKKIQDFQEQKYEILVGTQMVAKGLNFPNVTLVGVLAIDNMLCSADFRCHERMFSLLTQIVGRSGRGDKLGRAIIQTYNPADQTILQAAKQNFENFYRDEIIERESFFCPPFCDLCVVNFSGLDQKKVMECARKFVNACKKYATPAVPIQLLGISTPYLEILNKRYRKRIIIKCKNNNKFRNWIRPIAIEVFSFGNFFKIRCNIDMNGEIM